MKLCTRTCVVGSSPTRGSSFFLGKVTALGVLCCFALFVLSNYYYTDFYDEGFRRGDNSECVPTDGNEAEKRVRNGLVIACFVLSLLVLVEWSVCAVLWRCGVVDSASEKKER